MLFYELIRIALEQKGSLSKDPFNYEWKTMFEQSQKQAVAGIAFLALERLAQGGQKPPLPLLYEWIGISERIKAQNRLLNKRCIEITKIFEKAGFRSCILKGQGNALMYPDPLLRTSGDIDIWVEGNRKEIRDFVTSRCPHAQDGDMHIEFPVFRDVTIEVHYKPSYSSIPKFERRLQAWFKSQADEQFTNGVSLTGVAEKEICVPTMMFNAIQQMSHIMGHFFVEGIGLRQFVDYYYVLNHSDVRGRKEEIREGFRWLGLEKFASGVMWIEKEILGIDEQCLIVEPNKRLGRLILNEMMEGGSFGHYDQRYLLRNKGYLARGLVDSYRLLKLAYYFPHNALWKIVRKVENQKWKMKRKGN